MSPFPINILSRLPHLGLGGFYQCPCYIFESIKSLKHLPTNGFNSTFNSSVVFLNDLFYHSVISNKVVLHTVQMNPQMCKSPENDPNEVKTARLFAKQVVQVKPKRVG